MSGTTVMTEEERQAFLADVHVGIISIVEPDRGPLTVPIWYSYEAGGDVLVLMQAECRKKRAIDAAGRFSLCAQDESAPYKYVTAEGPVTNVRPYEIETDLLAMAARYLGDEGARMYIEQAGPESPGVLISMTPEHWLSTDYSKR